MTLSAFFGRFYCYLVAASGEICVDRLRFSFVQHSYETMCRGDGPTFNSDLFLSNMIT